MRELIYRRAATGYTIDRSAEGISQAKRHTGSQYVSIAMDETSEAISYRQFRLDDGTIALSAAYLDKYGDRKSILGHIVYADADEVEALLDSYPSCTGYFSRFKSNYAENQTLASNDDARMIFPLSEFLEPRKDGLKVKVLEVLKRIFPVKENLEMMFDALLDVASNNPKMILILGPDEKDDIVAERGRQIIEYLFSCIPNVISKRIGYVTPAVNDKGNTVFGVRYSRKREIDKEMRSFAYIYNYVENTFKAPPKANSAANEYAKELADLVYRCDQKAVDRIQKLKDLLNDPALYSNETVPEDLIIRYRFYNGYQNLDAQEKEELLDWHAKVVKNVYKTKDEKEKTRFWSVINRWIYEIVLKDVYAQSLNLDYQHPIYSFKRLKEIFETAQLMHEMGWKEAEIYRDYFEALLDEKFSLTGEIKERFEKELVSEIVRKVKAAKQTDDLSGLLYWHDLEKWFEKEYQKGRFFDNKEVFSIVRQLVDLKSQYSDNYVNAYADYCEKKDILINGLTGSEFTGRVVEKLKKDKRTFVTGQISRELKKSNPFLVGENRARYLSFKAVIGLDEQLNSIYKEIAEMHFKTRLLSMQKMHVEMLIQDFKSNDSENTLSGIMQKIHPAYNAKADVENRIIELTKSDGIIPYYPEKVNVCRDLAEILDRRFPQANYAEKLRALEKANRIHEETIDQNEFDRLMTEGLADERDSALWAKVRELIWKNVSASNEEKAMDFDKLLALLSIRNRTSRAFNPVGILRDFENLGFEIKKIQSHVKKLADSEQHRGIGYIARIVKEHCSADKTHAVDEWEDYPGEVVEKRIKKMFSGFPMAAAVVLMLLSGTGLAFSAIGILKTIGLL